MEALFKKYFWVVNVLVILLVSYLVASTSSEYLSDKYFAIPRGGAGLRSDDGDAKAEKPALPGLRGTGGRGDYASVLTSRNVFNADRIVEVQTGDESDGEGEEEPGEDTAVDEIRDSELAVNLLGTLVAPDPSESMATIRMAGSSKLVWIGSEIRKDPSDETALARVTDIARKYILVREGKEVRKIRLWGERKRFGGRKGARPTPKRPEQPRGRPKAKTDYSKGVKKISEYKYEIDRTMLNEQLSDLSQLGMQARIVPNYRGGKYQGFKLIGVRPGSLYRSIGIRSGDIVKRINGEEINSPNKAIKLFEKLKSSNNIRLDIERRGQTKTLEYTIR